KSTESTREGAEKRHEHQRARTPEEIAAEQAAMMAGTAPTVMAEPANQEEAPAVSDVAAAAAPMDIPPPPTDPAGPGIPPPTDPAGEKPSAAAMAAQMLTQQAVTDALGADVPPREAAERVTFATWAIVTGKSPGGIFNALPALDDATAEKLAQRLTERVEGTITVEDVKTAPTIEALATVV